MAEYLPVLVFLVMIVAFGGVSLVAAALVRPARPTPAKLESYECGPEPIGPAWIRFPVGFYLVALVFIGLPFVVRTVQPVLEELEAEKEEAAATLGAGRLSVFWKVLFPSVRPALLTADGRPAGHAGKAAKGLLARALLQSDDVDEVLATFDPAAQGLVGSDHLTLVVESSAVH